MFFSTTAAAADADSPERPGGRIARRLQLLNCCKSGCGCADKPGWLWLWPLRMAKCVSERETRRQAKGGTRRCRDTAFAGGIWNGPRGQCGRSGLVFLALARSAARRLGDSAAWRPAGSPAHSCRLTTGPVGEIPEPDYVAARYRISDHKTQPGAPSPGWSEAHTGTCCVGNALKESYSEKKGTSTWGVSGRLSRARDRPPASRRAAADL